MSFYVLNTIYLLIVTGHLFCTKKILPLLEPTLLWNFLLWVLQCEIHCKLMQNDLLWRRPVVMFSKDICWYCRRWLTRNILLIFCLPDVSSFAMTNVQRPKNVLMLSDLSPSAVMMRRNQGFWFRASQGWLEN